MMKKILQNSFGMSFFEMLAGAAIFGAVSVVAFKNLTVSQKNIKDTRNRVAIETATKSVSDLLKKKALCELAFSNINNVNALVNGIELKPKEESPDAVPECPQRPTEPLPRELTETEYQVLMQDFIRRCQTQSGIDGREGDDMGPSGGTPEGCSDRPSRYRYSEEEFDQIRQQYQRDLEAFENCEQPELQEVPEEIPPEILENDQVFNTGAGIIDLRRTDIQLNKELQGGIKLSSVNIKLDGASDGEVPIVFSLEFEVGIPGKTQMIEGQEVPATRVITREIEMMVQVTNGKIVCDNLQGASILGSATEKICAELGGVMSGSRCDLSSGLDSELEDRLRLTMCEALDASGSGALASGLCSKIELAGSIEGQNLSPNKLAINGQERNRFDNTACPTYLGGYQVGGSKICKSISYSFTSGALPLCDDNDGFYISGNNEPDDTATCTERDYTYNAISDSCTFSNLASDTAGLCKVFQANTCEGPTAGVVVDAPNGESCGASMACSSGNCIPAPDCQDEYTISGDETAEGTSYCNLADRTVNFDFSGCDETSTRTETAGACKRFQTGTCTGSTAGVLENYPDGTPCGGGNTCAAGTCGGSTPNTCYATEAACLAENSQCWDHSDIYWQFIDMDRVSGCTSGNRSLDCNTRGQPNMNECDRAGKVINCAICTANELNTDNIEWSCVRDVPSEPWCNYEGDNDGGGNWRGMRDDDEVGDPPPTDPPVGKCEFRPGLPCTILQDSTFYAGGLVDPRAQPAKCAEPGYACGADQCNSGADCICRARISGPGVRPERRCP